MLDMLDQWKAEHRAHKGGGPGPLRVESSDLASAINAAERAEQAYHCVLDDHFRVRASAWEVGVARVHMMAAWSRVVALHTVARAKVMPDPQSHPKYA